MQQCIDGNKPQIEQDVFVAENATIIGDVRIGSGSSVWFGAVIRGDLTSVEIGKNTNVQDNVVIHVDRNKKTIIGNNVTIGHGAIVHGCKIGNGVLIGIGAIVLDGAIIGDGALIGAGAVVTGASEIPAGSLALGAPAKPVKQMSDIQVKQLTEHAGRYCDLADKYKTETD